MFRALIASMVLLASASCCDTRDRMEKQCRDDCTSYGAGYMRLKPTCGNSDGCCSSEGDYECWCRKGAEQGSGSEPLRIW